MFDNKMNIEFIKGNFTSPILGNVYIGKRAKLDKKTAQQFIKNGYAVETDEKPLDNNPLKPQSDEDADDKGAGEGNQPDPVPPAAPAPAPIAAPAQNAKGKKNGGRNKSKRG